MSNSSSSSNNGQGNNTPNQNNAPSPDRWIKCISQKGNIRGVAIEATGLIQAIADRHHYSEVSTRSVGEAVMGALLIASFCKTGERVNLNIRGSGFIQQALVDAYPEGVVRGYVIERERASSLQPEEKSGPWGEGLLSVLRTKNQESGTPYIGTVPLLTGHLAKDLSFYWVQSEQIPSAVGLAVHLSEGKVVAARGFLVQAMPGASLHDIQEIERNIHEVSANLSEEFSPIQLLSQIFQDMTFLVIEEKPIRFDCHCSRDRVMKALTLVGVDELTAMLEEKKTASVHCDFCATDYNIDESALRALIQNVKPI